MTKRLLSIRRRWRLTAYLLVPTTAVTLIYFCPFAIAIEANKHERASRVLPSGLRIEEHLLRENPQGDDATGPHIEPAYGTFEDIVNRHGNELGKRKFVGRSNDAVIDNEKLEAEDYIIDRSRGGRSLVGVRLSRKGKILFSEVLGDSSPVGGVEGLWAEQKSWVLEVVRCKNDERTEGKITVIHTSCRGDIIRDGISLNGARGYTESFGFRFLHDKPFYFFERDGQLGLSYGGEETTLGYEEIIHHRCCSLSKLNPRAFQNMEVFLARRGNSWYYATVDMLPRSK